MQRLLLSVLLISFASVASAKGERAGDFDYYVLALSWSPNWCTREGDAKNSPQCDAGKEHGWILHGLWPQYHQGWPSYCPTAERAPSRQMTNGMADIMGTSGLAWHQWNKHGTCTGLSAVDYFETSREAYESISRPQVFRRIEERISLPANLIEQAFIKENPTIEPDGLTVTCKSGFIQEARICLSKELSPVPCGRDVIRDCNLQDALFDPLR